MKDYIFKFEADKGWHYKGVLTAYMDNRNIDAQFPLLPATPQSWKIEVLGFIWTDAELNWHMKVRVKFPSGNKQVAERSYGQNANETLVLHDIYRLPMVHKNWFRNPCGTLEGLIQLMLKNDLIESITKVQT